ISHVTQGTNQRIASALGRRFTANLSVQVLVISVFKWEGTIFRCVVAGAGVSDMALFVVLEIKNPTGYWWGAGSGGVLRFHERSGLEWRGERKQRD
ncbi:hypothetical protein ACTXJX_16580, partial [Glutamicibacter ardleyensis]|uniref:hypothetical protein n=2 Tax=Glutamicibacter ardleyensis TaxID=225894 RepID=UPI003FD10851